MTVVGHEKLMKFLIDHLLIKLSFLMNSPANCIKTDLNIIFYFPITPSHVHPFVCFVFNVANELNSNVMKTNKQ